MNTFIFLIIFITIVVSLIFIKFLNKPHQKILVLKKLILNYFNSNLMK